MNKTNVQRNYKDTVFRMLFKEKENLLSLYNALNGTAYTDVDNILSDFLAKNRAEVIAVSIFEYDEEKHMKSEREEERDDLALMLKSLMDAGKTEELNRALSDKEYREQLYREYFSKSE